MTLERLLVIEPSDVQALRLQCAKCRAVLSLRLSETVLVPHACPSCHEEWHTETSGPVDQLVRGLKAVQQGPQNRTFWIGLELVPEDTPKFWKFTGKD